MSALFTATALIANGVESVYYAQKTSTVQFNPYRTSIGIPQF